LYHLHSDNSLVGSVSNSSRTVHQQQQQQQQQQRSAPPSIITQVQFVHRKKSVLSTADHDTCASLATVTGNESIDDLEANVGKRHHHRKQVVGDASKVVRPTLARKNSKSCGSIPTKINLEIASASSSSPRTSTTTAAVISLPRVSGGPCCGSSGTVSNSGQLAHTTNGVEVVAVEEDNGDSTSIAGHQLLVAFSGKTMKPIPSNGISIERSVMLVNKLFMFEQFW